MPPFSKIEILEFPATEVTTICQNKNLFIMKLAVFFLHNIKINAERTFDRKTNFLEQNLQQDHFLLKQSE